MWSEEKKTVVGGCLWCSEVFRHVIVIEPNGCNSCYLLKIVFLKVKPEEQLTDPLSTDLLYHQLWRKYVLDDSVRKFNKDRLLALFDKLVSTMYERQ